MKIRWTFSLAAVALLAGIFPALAQQGSPFTPPKSTERQQTDRKLDAIAKTPYVTKRQADNLKKIQDKAEERNADDKLSDPSASTPSSSTSPEEKEPATTPNPEPPQDPPKEEAKPPTVRLMGTVCGTGEGLAIFDKGAEYPAMLREGDQLDEVTKVVKIDRGHVRLERTVVTTKDKVQQETKETYELYAW